MTGANDAPVVTVPAAQTTPEDTPKAISGVAVADVDSATLTTTVSVLHGSLLVTVGGGVTISNNGSATVTLSGSAAQINAALAGLTYTNTADYNGSDTLTVVSSDGALSATNTVGITVSPVADIANDNVTMKEDGRLRIDVNANDTFENAGHLISAINGTSISVGSSMAVSNGSVTLNADGTLTFAPSANYNGTTSFTYTVSSGGVTETATVNVVVAPGIDLSAKWVDYWQFNEGSGTATTNYNPFADQLGTITNNTPHAGQQADPAANLQPTWTTGRDGSAAIQFNGVGGTSAQRDGGWVALPTSVTDPLAGQSTAKAASLSFWIKTTQVGSSIGWDSPSVIGMENNGGTVDVQWGFINNQGKIGFGMGDYAGLMSNNPVNDNAWHNVIISHDFVSGATYMWVDGVAQAINGSTLWAGGIAPNKFLGFGVTADDGVTSNRFLNGGLDDVRIYDGLLTTGQAQAIYETELFGNQPNVIANDGRAVHFSLAMSDASSLVLSGLVSGTVVTDGTHSGTVGAGGTLDISSWGASDIAISNYGASSFMMAVTGTDASGNKATQFLSVVNNADSYVGTTGNDNLNASANSNAHVLFGGAGDDVLTGGGGVDMLIGGAGNDTINGGAGADVIVFNYATRGGTDTIQNFGTAAGTDILDLRDLLQGELHTGTDAGNLANYLHFTASGGTTTVAVSSSGSGATDQTIVLSGVDLVTGVVPVGGQTLDQAIIQNLLTNGKLITD